MPRVYGLETIYVLPQSTAINYMVYSLSIRKQSIPSIYVSFAFFFPRNYMISMLLPHIDYIPFYIQHTRSKIYVSLTPLISRIYPLNQYIANFPNTTYVANLSFILYMVTLCSVQHATRICIHRHV